MMRRSRSVFVALALLVSFTLYDTRNASAVIDPFTLYVVGSAVVHAVIIGGAYVGYKYYKKENGGTRDANGTKVTPNGTIGRDVNVTWVDISTGVPEIRTKSVTAKISHDKLKSAVSANPSKYPKLNTALNTSTITVAFTPDNLRTFDVGSSKKISDTQYFIVDSVLEVVDPAQISWPNWSSGPSPTTYNSTPCYVIYASTSEYWSETNHSFYKGVSKYVTGHYVSTPPPPVPVSPVSFAKTVSAKTAVTIPENVYSDYYQEIDDYITDNPNVMEYVDTEDSSQVDNAPVSPAPSVPSPSQYQAAVDTKAAIDSAQKAATSAQTAADNAKTKYDTTGTDEDKQKWLDAQATADKAKADADALGAQVTTDSSLGDSDSYYSAQNPSYGDGTENDVGSRVDEFFTDLKGTSLFSLPDRLLSGLPSGGSPVFTVNAGRWGTHQIDFSQQATALNLIKTVMLIGFTFAGIRILVLKGGSE